MSKPRFFQVPVINEIEDSTRLEGLEPSTLDFGNLRSTS